MWFRGTDTGSNKGLYGLQGFWLLVWGLGGSGLKVSIWPIARVERPAFRFSVISLVSGGFNYHLLPCRFSESGV